MNSLFSIFDSSSLLSSVIPNPHSGSKNSGQIPTVPLIAVEKTFAQKLVEVLSVQDDRAAVFTRLQTVLSSDKNTNVETISSSLLNLVPDTDDIDRLGVTEQDIAKLQSHPLLKSIENAFASDPESKNLVDRIVQLLAPSSLKSPSPSNEFGLPAEQEFSDVHAPRVLFATTSVNATNRDLVQTTDVTVQEDSIQRSGIAGNVLGNSTSPLPESVVSKLNAEQGSALKKQELELLPQGSIPKLVSNSSPPEITKEEILVGRPVRSTERTLPVNELPPTSPQQQKGEPDLKPLQRIQQIPFDSDIPKQVKSPVGLLTPDLADQILAKPISVSGNSSSVKEGSGMGQEYRQPLVTDFISENGTRGKGDRVQWVSESSVKTLNVDSSAGQGLGGGLNQFFQSQSGFQQPSLLSGQGVGWRSLDEVRPEIPAPALQRLQMDVQLSENQRVQIDVGVQNRLVTAGLIVDHSLLRTLANQFVPQLEQQLSQVNLELQEFSAEIREEPDQQTSMQFDESKFHKAKKTGQLSEHERPSTHMPLVPQGEQGLHLVA